MADRAERAMTPERETETLYAALAEDAPESTELGQTVVTKQRETTDESTVLLPLES